MAVKLKRAFTPEAICFYVAMLIPVPIGFVFGKAWTGIVAAFVIIAVAALVKRWAEP